MRDKSKKEGIDHKPPSNLSSDGVDAWYMMQRHREQELRKRRKEAAEILRGYRAPYQDDQSVEWGTSPTYRRSRASFGDANLSESLTDPASPAHGWRRQSAMPRMEHGWDEREELDEGRFDDDNNPRHRLSSERTDFLRDQPTYPNEQYDRSVFTGAHDMYDDDPNFFSPAAVNNNSDARNIDTIPSETRLRDAEEKKRNASMGASGKEAEPQLPETIWRDFISPGKYQTALVFTLLQTFEDFLTWCLFVKLDRTWRQVPPRGWKVPLVCFVCMPWITQSTYRPSFERIGGYYICYHRTPYLASY